MNNKVNIEEAYHKNGFILPNGVFQSIDIKMLPNISKQLFLANAFCKEFELEDSAYKHYDDLVENSNYQVRDEISKKVVDQINYSLKTLTNLSEKELEESTNLYMKKLFAPYEYVVHYLNNMPYFYDDPELNKKSLQVLGQSFNKHQLKVFQILNMLNEIELENDNGLERI